MKYEVIRRFGRNHWPPERTVAVCETIAQANEYVARQLIDQAADRLICETDRDAYLIVQRDDLALPGFE